jgi:hypothetical protein
MTLRILPVLSSLPLHLSVPIFKFIFQSSANLHLAHKSEPSAKKNVCDWQWQSWLLSLPW